MPNKILKRQLSQRSGDGVWVVWGLIDDPNISREEWDLCFRGSPELKFPMRWVPVKTYDWLIELTTE